MDETPRASTEYSRESSQSVGCFLIHRGLPGDFPGVHRAVATLKARDATESATMLFTNITNTTNNTNGTTNKQSKRVQMVQMGSFHTPEPTPEVEAAGHTQSSGRSWASMTRPLESASMQPAEALLLSLQYYSAYWSNRLLLLRRFSEGSWVSQQQPQLPSAS